MESEEGDGIKIKQFKQPGSLFNDAMIRYRL